MTEEELERRIALKKMFAERLQNISITPVEPGKSKLTSYSNYDSKPLKKATFKNRRAIKNNFLKLKKTCFSPVVVIDENNLNYSGSKYFGNVWLSDDETWPTVDGVFLTFVFQLEISSLPKEYSKKLGGSGTLQFFFDGTDYPGESLIRIVHPNENGKYHSQPRHKDNYLISDSFPKQKIITSWNQHPDYPHSSEVFEDEKHQEILDSFFDNDYDTSTFQGDKLGGYAFWAQDGESSDDLIFQISAGDFYDGNSFDSHAPSLFASDGNAHIFYNTEDKSFYFDWACG